MAAAQEADHQLAIGIQSRSRPAIASFDRRSFGGRNILLLRMDEAPNFVALDPPGLDAPNLAVMEHLASLTGFQKQLRNRVGRHIRDACDGVHRGTLAEHGKDLNALGGVELVHARRDMNFHA